MSEKKIVSVCFNVELEEKDVQGFRSMIGHHIDYFLNLEEYPEVERVYSADAEINETGEAANIFWGNLKRINDIVDDINMFYRRDVAEKIDKSELPFSYDDIEEIDNVVRKIARDYVMNGEEDANRSEWENIYSYVNDYNIVNAYVSDIEAK